MDALRRALNANRAEVKRALRDAQEELRELRQREKLLEETIQRAGLVLGIDPMIALADPVPDEHEPRLTRLPLHEALAQVLRMHGNRPMSARELADQVNANRLYSKRDGSLVEPGQIHARVHNYDRMFERASGGIRLRDIPTRQADATLESKFDSAMLEVYGSAMREVGYPARRFLAMIRGRGGVEAARQLLSKAGVSEGFRRLSDTRKLHLTMEFQVLQSEFRDLFTNEEREIARQRLLDAGLPEAELPE
jgi:hypothetical protein